MNVDLNHYAAAGFIHYLPIIFLAHFFATAKHEQPSDFCNFRAAHPSPMTNGTKKSLPIHGIFLGARKIRHCSCPETMRFSKCRIFSRCATLVHFLLTLELDIELEFDGLLCIVTRAIAYPSERTRFAIVKLIFFSLFTRNFFAELTHWENGRGAGSSRLRRLLKCLCRRGERNVRWVTIESLPVNYC